MANGYAKIFTLQDIFNNPELARKIPLVNYKESVDSTGKEHRRTNMKSIARLVFETAKASAKPYYAPLKAHKAGDLIDIGGNLTGDYDAAYEAVYKGLVAQKSIMTYTVNNADMIRTALKEGAALKRSTGTEPKLWLRVGSVQEIKSMGKRELNTLMDDVMRNIFYNPEFEKTQKKYKVVDIPVNRSYNYERRRDNWLRKVGDL